MALIQNYLKSQQDLIKYLQGLDPEKRFEAAYSVLGSGGRALGLALGWDLALGKTLQSYEKSNVSYDQYGIPTNAASLWGLDINDIVSRMLTKGGSSLLGGTYDEKLGNAQSTVRDRLSTGTKDEYAMSNFKDLVQQQRSMLEQLPDFLFKDDNKKTVTNALNQYESSTLGTQTTPAAVAQAQKSAVETSGMPAGTTYEQLQAQMAKQQAQAPAAPTITPTTPAPQDYQFTRDQLSVALQDPQIALKLQPYGGSVEKMTELALKGDAQAQAVRQAIFDRAYQGVETGQQPQTRNLAKEQEAAQTLKPQFAGQDFNKPEVKEAFFEAVNKQVYSQPVPPGQTPEAQKTAAAGPIGTSAAPAPTPAQPEAISTAVIPKTTTEDIFKKAIEERPQLNLPSAPPILPATAPPTTQTPSIQDFIAQQNKDLMAQMKELQAPQLAAQQELLKTMRERPSAVDTLTRLRQEQGLPQLEKAVSMVDQQILDTENLLSKLEGDIQTRVEGMPVTEAAKRRLLARERSPLTQQLSDLIRGRTRLETGLTAKQQLAQQIAGATEQDTARQEQIAQTGLGFATQQTKTGMDLFQEFQSRQLTGFTTDKETELQRLRDEQTAKAKLSSAQQTRLDKLQDMEIEFQNSVALEKMKSGKPQEVSPGASLIDPTTGRVIATAPKVGMAGGGADTPTPTTKPNIILTQNDKNQVAALGIQNWPIKTQNVVLRALTPTEQKEFIRDFNNEEQRRGQSLDPIAYIQEWALLRSEESGIVNPFK